MGSAWVSALVVLLAFVNGARNASEGDSLPCAEVKVSSTVVMLGSPVTASCFIRNGCRLAEVQADRMEWHLGQTLLPSGPAVNNSSGRLSLVLIPHFNATREYLTCCLKSSTCLIVGGAEIQGGYPPPVPGNVSCQTNLTIPNTMSCSWDLGQKETNLPTKYSLHTYIRDTNRNHMYELSAGVHRYTIPRSDFAYYSDMEIRVKAENALGETSSVPVVLEPLRSAKFNPPTMVKVQAAPNKYGSLRFSWRLSRHESWVPARRLNLEVRLKVAMASQWSQQPVLLTRVSPSRPSEVSNLLHGTEYDVQIRVRYQQSPWSEWSPSQSGVTAEKAPCGRLDSWTKVSGEPRQKRLGVHLFWKPSKQFRPNGNVSYVVSLRRTPGKLGQLCSTARPYCAFQLPSVVKKVFLYAVNSAGKSVPTEVPVLPQRECTALAGVSVLMLDDTSLLVQWESLESSGITGYVVEWRPEQDQDPSLTFFDLADRNQSSLVITGIFQPYTAYRISVYPKYKNMIGCPLTSEAYTKQKAPSMVPKIKVTENGRSDIKLTWDEIPLNQRNGIIRDYTVYYWNDEEHIRAVKADLKKRSVVLTNLDYQSVYNAFIMVSTDAGSLNGSIVTLKTEPMDALTIVMILIACLIALPILFFCGFVFSLFNRERLKVCLWPIIPDPANSSIKKWSSDTIQDITLAWDIQEPNPVYLTHLSILDLSMKLDKGDPDKWRHSSSEETSDLGGSICSTPVTPDYDRSMSDSVPYATVVFSEPYASQSAGQPHRYLRSESTQPLLEAEEPYTPKSYQNMSADGLHGEGCFFGSCQGVIPENRESDTLFDDFPLLRALVISDAQSENSL